MRHLVSALIVASGALAGVASAETSQIVDAGRYLVTVSFAEDCSPSAMDLSKSWMFAAASFEPADRDEALISVAGRVKDNVIRTMVCRSGFSTGSIVVAPQAETELKVAEAELERSGIAISVESIDAVKSVAKNKSRVTLAAGEYLVDVQGWDGCNGGFEVNLVREYDVRYPETVADRLMFKANGLVSDNWIRTAVCRSGFLTGTAHVVLGKKTTIFPPKGYKILAVSQVVAKSPF